MMSYLTNKRLDSECEDLLYCLTKFCVFYTQTQLFTTYIFIKIFLRVKHSRTIWIAEEQNSLSSILGFKKLLMLLFLLCSCIFSMDLVRQKQMYNIKEDTSPPPMMPLSAVLASLWSNFFIWSKKDIRAFVKRKLRGQFEYMFPNLNWRPTKIEPAEMVPSPPDQHQTTNK